MTLQEFYFRHFGHVITRMSAWPRNSVKLCTLWNDVFPDMKKAEGHSFNDSELDLLTAEMTHKVQHIRKLSDKQLRKHCLFGCTLFHEPGDAEVHELLGDLQFIRRADSDHPDRVEQWGRCKITGEEVLLAVEE